MRRTLLLVPLLLAACTSNGESTDPVAAIELADVGDKLTDDAKAVLEAPDTVELVALHPYPWDEGEPASEEEAFHGYKVLGRADATDAVDARQAVALVYEAVAEHPDMYAACFNPRHGLRATKGDDVLDLVICFECLQMHVFVPSGERRSAGVADGPEARMTALYERYGLTIHRD